MPLPRAVAHHGREPSAHTACTLVATRRPLDRGQERVLHEVVGRVRIRRELARQRMKEPGFREQRVRLERSVSVHDVQQNADIRRA
jgi:hypothetical protein